MANHENEITRFSFTEEALEEGSPHLERFPGFFSNGPEHFDAHILNGESYLNTVFSLTLAIKTRAGLKVHTGVRQLYVPPKKKKEEKELNRQGVVSSVVTIRDTQARARYLMNAANEFRVPILGGEIGEEGYHITECDPRNPVLVADYEPGAQLEGEADDLLMDIFYNLVDKTQRPDHPKGFYNIDNLLEHAKVWLGPTLVGTSEVGMYFKQNPEAQNIPLIMDPEDREEPIRGGGRPIMEAHNFHSIVAFIDLSTHWIDDVMKYFMHANEHYSHFDLASIDKFEEGVKSGNVDLITPSLAYSRQMDLLYLMACARGMCLRTAAAGLARHLAYIRKLSGYKELSSPTEQTYKDGLYRPPMKLTLPATRTIIDLGSSREQF